MTTKNGYARSNLGGGNALKAITRTRRAAASRQLGGVPAVRKARERRLAAEVLELLEKRAAIAEQEAA